MTDCSTLSSVKVKNEKELYIISTACSGTFHGELLWGKSCEVYIIVTSISFVVVVLVGCEFENLCIIDAPFLKGRACSNLVEGCRMT